MNAYCTRCGGWRLLTGYCGLCEECMTTWQATHARGLSRTTTASQEGKRTL